MQSLGVTVNEVVAKEFSKLAGKLARKWAETDCRGTFRVMWLGLRLLGSVRRSLHRSAVRPDRFPGECIWEIPYISNRMILLYKVVTYPQFRGIGFWRGLAQNDFTMALSKELIARLREHFALDWHGRERGMRKFKSVKQAQRFLGAHAAVYNLFNLGRHLVSAKNYRYFRLRAFASWEKAVAM